jgi:hypothetical protein
MEIFKVSDILGKLNNCIEYKKPFSHIRFGDGGIKFIHSILFDDDTQLKEIINKEGLPWEQVDKIINLWGYYARRADFIDTPEVYYNGTFWERIKKPGKAITQKTYDRMIMWEELYSRAEFDNDKYCNPESNYLMVLRMEGRKNLLDIMKKRKICLITARPHVKRVLQNFNIDIVEIVGQYENQYSKSFDSVIKIIKENAPRYDFWLVAAGELGRIYSGYIKECGGRSIDIGFIIEYWLGQPIHPRLKVFMEERGLELKLSKLGDQYGRFI